MQKSKQKILSKLISFQCCLVLVFSSFILLAEECKDLSDLTLTTPTGNLSIKQRMKELNINGISIALINNFSIKCTFTAGITDTTTNNKVTPHTLFQVASISKPVTAVATLKLAQEGLISISHPVNDYLRSWKLSSKNKSYEPALIRQLLNHTGGINVPSFAGYEANSLIPSTKNILRGTAGANSGAVFVELKPNSEYKYSGGGYTVLEMLISDVTKQSFQQYVEKSILAKLNMHNSRFDQPINIAKYPNIALGYSNRLPIEGGYFVYPELAAAGMWSTAEDIGKFVIGLQNSIQESPDALLSSNSMRDMLSPYKDSMSGLGIVVDDMYFSHTGHNNGYVSMMLGHDKKGYGLAILTNAEKPRIISEIIMAVGKRYKWEEF